MEKYRNYPKIIGQTECHHIIPRSLGGSDQVSNLVNLPYRVHFVCHWLLSRCFPSDSEQYRSMYHAFWMMSGRTLTVNSLVYSKIKSNYSNLQNQLIQEGRHN